MVLTLCMLHPNSVKRPKCGILPSTTAQDNSIQQHMMLPARWILLDKKQRHIAAAPSKQPASEQHMPRSLQGCLVVCLHISSCWVCTHLFRKATCSNELEGLHLPKVRGVAQHVYVHELGDVAVSVPSILLPESLTQRCTLLGNHITLLCCCLAGTDCTDQVPADDSSMVACMIWPQLLQQMHELYCPHLRRELMVLLLRALFTQTHLLH